MKAYRVWRVKLGAKDATASSAYELRERADIERGNQQTMYDARPASHCSCEWCKGHAIHFEVREEEVPGEIFNGIHVLETYFVVLGNDLEQTNVRDIQLAAVEPS